MIKSFFLNQSKKFASSVKKKKEIVKPERIISVLKTKTEHGGILSTVHKDLDEKNPIDFYKIEDAAGDDAVTFYILGPQALLQGFLFLCFVFHIKIIFTFGVGGGDFQSKADFSFVFHFF